MNVFLDVIPKSMQVDPGKAVGGRKPIDERTTTKQYGEYGKELRSAANEGAGLNANCGIRQQTEEGAPGLQKLEGNE